MSRPAVRAPKPNQHERAQRQGAIDVLLQRALRGVLTIPEAAVLADYVRAERRNADQTRISLGHTTRTLNLHRQAADVEIQRLEAVISRVRDLRDDLREITGARYIADTLDSILGASTPDPAAGPTVAEAAAHDRAHWNDKYAREQP